MQHSIDMGMAVALLDEMGDPFGQQKEDHRVQLKHALSVIVGLFLGLVVLSGCAGLAPTALAASRCGRVFTP